MIKIKLTIANTQCSSCICDSGETFLIGETAEVLCAICAYERAIKNIESSEDAKSLIQKARDEVKEKGQFYATYLKERYDGAYLTFSLYNNRHECIGELEYKRFTMSVSVSELNNFDKYAWGGLTHIENAVREACVSGDYQRTIEY